MNITLLGICPLSRNMGVPRRACPGGNDPNDLPYSALKAPYAAI